MCKKLHAANRVINVIQFLCRKAERDVGILEFGEATKPTDQDNESFQGRKQILMR